MSDIETPPRPLELPLHRRHVFQICSTTIPRTEQCIIPNATQEARFFFCRTTPASAGATSSKRCI